MGIGIGYDVKPSTIPANVKISVNNTTLHAQIQDIGDFGFSITPNGGGIAEDILSAIAWPIANLVAPILKDKAINAINGTGFDVMSVPNIPIQVNGITLTLQPANMNLANYDGMLLIGCDVNIV
jgi:hypothetical protein